VSSARHPILFVDMDAFCELDIYPLVLVVCPGFVHSLGSEHSTTNAVIFDDIVARICGFPTGHTTP
jgi:hypothetical protein